MLVQESISTQSAGGKEMDDKNKAMPHHIILEERRRLTVSGVSDVESFNENGVVCRTNRGTLLIKGSNLRVDKLSLEGGDLAVEGAVDSLLYENENPTGFFSRLFR